MLGLFVNNLTADDEYSPHNRDNFLQQIQMPLSQKPIIFSHRFIAFVKSASNFEYFEKKDESHSLCHSEIIDSDGVATKMGNRSIFSTHSSSNGLRSQKHW